MEQIKEFVKSKRPNLSQGSINTYSSILKSLFSKVFGEEHVDLGKFDDDEKVLEHLKGMPPNKRKTILSALVIITDKKAYRDLMLNDVRDYNKEIATQEKSPAQEASWVTGTEIKDIYNELKKTADFIYKKKSYTANDLQDIQSFIIMALISGQFVPPRRSKDIVDWKIKNINKEKDNYFEKNKIYYNSYKTAKTYGQQIVEIPTALKSILNKWIKINPTDYLLFDKNMNKLSSIKLNQRLNRIFNGKKVGINNMRHTFLTDKYAKHSEENKQLKNDMAEMGSSMNMVDTYIKLH